MAKKHRLGVEAAGRILRSVPRSLPGKTRLAKLALRFLRPSDPATVSDKFGNTLDCLSLQEPIAVALFSSGVYEPDTLEALLADLPQRGAILDVGANIGAIALPLAARRPDARIVCIEADPDIAAALRRNVARNGRSNVVVEECLAGAEHDPQVSFYRAPAHSFGMGSIGPQFHAEPVYLAQRTLDDVLDGLGIELVDRVKIDIEGAELGALQGLRRRLSGPRPPRVVFEFNDWAEARIPGQAPGDAQRFLQSLGFRLYRLGRRGERGPELDEPQTVGGAMLLAQA